MKKRTSWLRSWLMVHTSYMTLFSVTALFCINCQMAVAQSTPVDLQCDYLTQPLGIDSDHPVFSWKWQTADKASQEQELNGQQQEGSVGTSTPIYLKIRVATDSVALVQGNAKDINWAGYFFSARQPFVKYQGNELKPYTKYFWQLIWTHDTTSAEAGKSVISSFETGLRTASNWKGAWISDNHPIDFKPAGYFRKPFKLSNKRVKSARIYISAGGLYKLMLNGQRVGDRELDPIYTRFDRRLLYTTYDVTKNLQSGANALGVVMGNGWYNHQSTAVWGFDKAPWRARPAFCLDLRVVYEDGTVETISSGKDWKTRTGAIVFNSIYTAEHQDARLALHDWSKPHLKDQQWKKAYDSLWTPVIFRSSPAEKIVSSTLVPIRKFAPIMPVSMQRINDTDYVFNLGQNIAGISEVRIKGPKGTVVKVKHGERLYKNGHVDLSNIDVHYRPTDDSDPFQVDIYTLAGTGGTETFRPWFNYKGFQYVEITSSAPIELSKSDLTGYFMHSDVAPAGNIQSSDTILNKIWAATNQSYLSNLFGYPTDCPQREKNGWTGDGQINIQTGLYNFDAITVYDKWMNDHLDEQQPNGVLPSIIPTDGWGYEWGNGPDWTSTIAVIPWNLYLFYGNPAVLKKCYPAIKKYVDYITRISPTGICSWGLGDWVPVKSKTPVPFTSTIYYYTDVHILAQAAALFGKEQDHQYYLQLAAKIKKAFNDKYLDRENGMYGSGFQTELSAPIFWGLVPEGQLKQVAEHLNKTVVDNGYHLDVGLLGSKTILGALSKTGYANTAYKLAAQRTYPSWGWWMMNGATTLYENWNIESANDISLNHIMFGEIGAWLYSGLAGIQPDPAAPGFSNTLLRPIFPTDLSQYAASHTGPFGDIQVKWEREGKHKIHLEVTVPANSTAALSLPAGIQKVEMRGQKSRKDKKQRQEKEKGVRQLTAGVHVFTLRY